MSCYIKLGVVIGPHKFERVFDVRTLLLWAPHWLVRRTRLLTPGAQ